MGDLKMKLGWPQGGVAMFLIALVLGFSHAPIALAWELAPPPDPDPTRIVNGEGIESVRLESLNNVSGGATVHYTNTWQGIVFPIIRRELTYTVEVKASTGYTIAVFIDWDSSLRYEAGEKIGEVVQAPGPAPMLFTFTVPITAGDHPFGSNIIGLRVRALLGVSDIDPLTSAPALGDIGETEDYGIDIQDAFDYQDTMGDVIYVGETLSRTFSAIGGVGALSYPMVSGALPNGMQYNPTGLLSGFAMVGTDSVTPYDFVIRVTDSFLPVPNTRDIQYRLWIRPFRSLPLSIPDTTLPDAIVGDPFSHQIVATGGGNPLALVPFRTFAFVVGSGSLPPGMQFTSDGLLSGVATSVGTYTFSVTVEDRIGHSLTEAITISVVPPPPPPSPPTPMPPTPIHNAPVLYSSETAGCTLSAQRRSGQGLRLAVFIITVGAIVTIRRVFGSESKRCA